MPRIRVAHGPQGVDFDHHVRPDHALPVVALAADRALLDMAAGDIEILFREHQVLHEDFYYRTETLVELAAGYGLTARFMDDWEELPHRQSKMRLTAMSDRARTVGP